MSVAVTDEQHNDAVEMMLDPETGWIQEGRERDFLVNHQREGFTMQQLLRISDEMLSAINAVGAANRAKYEDLPEKVDGVEDRYDSQLELVYAQMSSEDFTYGVFLPDHDCENGGEVSMIYMHPIHGVDQKMSAEEYRLRTSPYVAGNLTEVFPGDLEAGLVHESVVGLLTK